jgi:hypothetical protein
MSAERPNIVFFFWDNLGWGKSAATAAGSCAGRRRVVRET